MPSSYNVTVNAIPVAPIVTLNGNVLTSSAQDGNQWYYEGTFIEGATGQTWTAVLSGTYWTLVTLNDCISPESNHVYVIIEGQKELETSNFIIYPVPGDGRFTASITNEKQEDYTIMVYNRTGARICELDDVKVNGTTEKQFDIRPVVSGIYSVVFFNSEHRVVRKVVVSRTGY